MDAFWPVNGRNEILVATDNIVATSFYPEGNEVTVLVTMSSPGLDYIE